MRFMNDYDIATALRRYNAYDTPNRRKVAVAVANLAEWTDQNSDGWPYWSKPARSAARAFDLLEGEGTNQSLHWLEDNDATDAEVTAALRPIKAFLTRQGIKDGLAILSAPVDSYSRYAS